jgi:hypothetical protein
LLLREARDPEGPRAPGLLVLDEDWRVHSTVPRIEAL